MSGLQIGRQTKEIVCRRQISRGRRRHVCIIFKLLFRTVSSEEESLVPTSKFQAILCKKLIHHEIESCMAQMAAPLRLDKCQPTSWEPFTGAGDAAKASVDCRPSPHAVVLRSSQSQYLVGVHLICYFSSLTRIIPIIPRQVKIHLLSFRMTRIRFS